jgi:hypothetical protein
MTYLLTTSCLSHSITLTSITWRDVLLSCLLADSGLEYAMDDTPEELDDVPQFVFTSYCYFTNTPFDE